MIHSCKETKEQKLYVIYSFACSNDYVGTMLFMEIPIPLDRLHSYSENMGGSNCSEMPLVWWNLGLGEQYMDSRSKVVTGQSRIHLWALCKQSRS